MHIRRLTDREAKAPFDCYHYRIIHQTFYGMRDVLAAGLYENAGIVQGMVVNTWPVPTTRAITVYV